MTTTPLPDLLTKGRALLATMPFPHTPMALNDVALALVPQDITELAALICDQEGLLADWLLVTPITVIRPANVLYWTVFEYLVQQLRLSLEGESRP